MPRRYRNTCKAEYRAQRRPRQANDRGFASLPDDDMKAQPQMYSAAALQSVKEPLFSRSEDKVLAAIWEEHSIKSGKRQSIPLPNGYLFQIHGSILEPHPSGNPGQTSVVCISHGVLFFCVSKDTLNGFFSHGINFLATLGFTQLFHQI